MSRSSAPASPPPSRAPRRAFARPWRGPTLLLALLLSGCPAAPEAPFRLEAPGPAPFLAGDARGPLAAFDLAESRGRVVLVTFGYTSCPDICPLALARLAQAKRLLGPGAEGGLEIVFVSVDPERDSPERLAHYVGAFGAGIRGLSLPPEGLARVLGGFGAFARRRESGGVVLAARTGTGERPYAVDHTAGTFAVGRDGRLRLFFPHDTPPEALGRALRALLEEAP